MSRYSAGFFTQSEEIEVKKLPVRGELPPWLSGTLVRNGPAKFEVGGQSYRHWFDGLSMLRRFTFDAGAVSYANRFLQSRDYVRSTRQNTIAMANFATDPCRSIFRRVLSVFSPDVTDNANVNVGKLDDRYIAMTETPLPIEFDPHTLATLGVFNYGRDKLDIATTTAHPHYDPRRGAISYATRFSRTSEYVVYRVPPGQRRRERLASLRVRRPAYMHSFGMTERYVVLVEFPLTVDPLRMLLSGRPFIENFAWEPERGSRFHVIDKDDGSVRTHRGAAFFAFHHVNAFESDGDVVVDIAAYPDSQIIDALYLDRLRAGDPIPQAELRRYRLRDGGEEAEFERLIEDSIELPRIRYDQVAGRPYRYAYGVSTRREPPGEFSNQLIKVDVHERGVRRWAEDGCYVGEPVFVAAPSAAAEDDGVFLSVVLDAEKSGAFLLVLEASSLAELARAEAPHPIPFGFHGEFFADL